MATIYELLLTSLLHSNQDSSLTPQGEIRQIVVFKRGYSPSGVTVAKLGGTVIQELPLINGLAVSFREPVSSRVLSVQRDILRIDEDLPVTIVGFEYIFFGLLLLLWLSSPKVGENASGETIPWGVEMVEAPAVWPLTKGEGVKVAVIDTGIDLEHRELQPNLRPGVNILARGEQPVDINGHGTHVAGTIGAADNGGLVGVSPRIEIYPVKALNDKGKGWLSDIIAAVQWCINNRMDIVNMSFVVGGENQSLRETIQRAHEAGLVLVAAAGNSGPGEESVRYPARYPEPIAVSALNRQGQLANFSSRGSGIDLVAPGVEVESLWPGGGKRSLNGTSMAAPHVSGVAALFLSKNGPMKPAELKRSLKEAARSLSNLKETEQGAGLVNARQALSRVLPLAEG